MGDDFCVERTQMPPENEGVPILIMMMMMMMITVMAAGHQCRLACQNLSHTGSVKPVLKVPTQGAC